MEYQSEDEYEWYQQQRRGVKNYERVLVGAAVIMLGFAIYYAWSCVCGSPQ